MTGPQIVLGTMCFGITTPEARALSILDRYAQLGGAWLDTADIYALWMDLERGHGHSERALGRWLADNPGTEMRLPTKVRFAPSPNGQWPDNAVGLSASAIAQAFDASLQRLAWLMQGPRCRARRSSASAASSSSRRPWPRVTSGWSRATSNS